MHYVKNLQILFLFFSLFSIAWADTPPLCSQSTMSRNLNISIPCVGIKDTQYAISLQLSGIDDQDLFWKVESIIESDCQWDYNTCATIYNGYHLSVPKLSFDGEEYSLFLELCENNSDLLKYSSHHFFSQTLGYSDSYGSLPNYTIQTIMNGENRKKLLAIYMVGSDLESSWNQSATVDLFELIDGYQTVNNADIDIIVAFGGSDKEGWRGMTFATIEQLITDSKDAKFGNNNDYLYRAPLAHMGDTSSLQIFLNFINQKYISYEQTFLALWDHGGAYNGFGMDQNYNSDLLSLREIENAFKNSNSRFTLIGFDACLMATAEVAKSFDGCADYLLASEDLEPGHGWNWEAVIKEYAKEASITDIGKNIIDNYINNNSHFFNSSGKTLSIVDLSLLEEVTEKIDAFLSNLNNRLLENTSIISEAVATALNLVRTYTEDHQLSIDLYDFAINILGLLGEGGEMESSIIEQAGSLINTLNRYVVYSQHDGTRPYSYGVTINSPRNLPSIANITSAVDLLQENWRRIIASDNNSPVVSEQRNEISANDADLWNSNLSKEDINALQKTIDELLSRGLITDIQRDSLNKGIDILKNQNLTLEEKLLSIDELENQERGIFPTPGFFRKAIFERGIFPFPRGIFPAYTYTQGVFPVTHDHSPTMKIKDRRIEPKRYPFERGERAAFTYIDHKSPTTPFGNLRNASQHADETLGTVAIFNDDNHLKVTTIYGTIKEDSSSEQSSFNMIAEIEAYPTQNMNEFFTPTWNRVWYTIQYDSNTPNLWIPLAFQNRFFYNSQPYMVYSARIHYRDGQKEYPEPTSPQEAIDICPKYGFVADDAGNCIELAVLELNVNEQNEVISQKIIPYNKQYMQDQGHERIVIDKTSKSLKAGDKIRFLYESLDMHSDNLIQWKSTTDSDFIVFTQPPVFSIELLGFQDPDTQEPQTLYYAMRAVDINGNMAMTTPQIAPVSIPSCDKLLETIISLTAASNYLNSNSMIVFNSPLGDRLDEANATLLTTSQALPNDIFSANITKLFSYLYSSETFDSENWTWNWNSVAWNEVKQILYTLRSDFDLIYENQCMK